MTSCDTWREAPPASARAGEVPVFNEPWEAHAFAIVLLLHERDLFTWPEWSSALAAQITAAKEDGDADLGDTYYRHWLNALEIIVTQKSASCAAELARYQQAWDHAAGRTPHGQPIELLSMDFPAIGSNT